MIPHVSIGRLALASMVLAGIASAQVVYQQVTRSSVNSLQDSRRTVSVLGDRALAANLDTAEVLCFERSGAQWQLTQKLSFPGAATFGEGVCLAGDHAFVAAPEDGLVVAFALDMPTGQWVMEHVFDGFIASAALGTALAFDGTSLFIGDPLLGDTTGGGSGPQGAVWIADLSGGVWSDVVQFGPPEPLMVSLGRRFGAAISISNGTLAVSDPSQGGTFGPGPGRIYIYEKDALGKWTLVDTIDGPAKALPGSFGSQVFLEGDEMIVSAPGNAEFAFSPANPGHVYVYGREATGWFLRQELQDPMIHPNAVFGARVALSGNLVLVSSVCLSAGFVTCDPDPSQVGAYSRDATGTWVPIGALSRPVRGNFGFGAALSLDGASAFIATLEQAPTSIEREFRVFAADLSSVTSKN